MVGLPLMQGLSPMQFRAVLAHEMGHLSRSHSKFTGWIYRLRRTWGQLMVQLQEKKQGWQFLFLPFLKNYAPKLDAYTFVLARENEYEADRLAAEATGTRNMADALIQLNVRRDQLDAHFWPEINKLPQSQSRPPKVFANMRLFLARQTSLSEHADRALKRALRTEASFEDTHPSLAERLQALGEETRLPLPAERSAAEVYLESSLETLMNQLDEHWQKEVETSWKQRVEQLNVMREELGKLRAERPEELTEQQAWNMAKLTEELHGQSEALPLYEALLERSGTLASASAYIAAGSALLQEDGPMSEAKATAYLNRAMELDSDFTFVCCDNMIAYYEKRGDEDKVQQWFEIGNGHAQLLGKARQERMDINPNDDFEPHGLEEYQLMPIIKELQLYPILTEAYLVRKKVVYTPEKPQFVLLIRNKRKLRVGKRVLAREVFQKLAQEEALPPETAIIVLNTQRKFKAVRELALTYPKGLLFRKGPELRLGSPVRIYKALIARLLMRAIDMRKTGTVSMLLTFGADPNRLTANMIPLSSAAKGGDIKTMNSLLRAGAQVDGRNNDGNTPLFWAAYHGHAEAVSCLLKHGADPNVRYVSGRSVLSPVCMHGYANILKLLLDAGAKPIYTCKADGETPLMIAAYNGRYECAALLLEAGVDPYMKDKHGNTALSFAKDYQNNSIVELLKARMAAS
ncbi:unnamed protein product [Aphanomyces euteiches]